jgi:two-component system OmpR family sensor kinase
VPAVDGEARFRALVLPQVNGSWLVTAQSLAEIDAALDRLVRTLWIAGAIIAGVLTIAVTWVHRLGLRPIARVTAIAEAIAAGDHSRRVALTNTRTEAGKLGYAFNLMLDERDAAETRLRQFVADASHELRTPLTSMRGYLELYRQGAFREPGRLDDVVRRLSAESSRMHGLVEDLLALASLDEDRPFQREPVDVGQLLRDAAQDGQATQPDRAIAVIAPRPGPVVTGDTALLTQLVGILVANALAHTPVSVPITLSADAHAATVTITVADRGPGLDSGAADRVFDRFWRGEAARTRSTGGTGLGLAIARSITDAHGGTISLETAPGEGCTFTVHLPRVTSNVGVSPSAS